EIVVLPFPLQRPRRSPSITRTPMKLHVVRGGFLLAWLVSVPPAFGYTPDSLGKAKGRVIDEKGPKQSSATLDSPREDSLALFGTWRWVHSGGGLLGADATPPLSGWWRLLRFQNDGTYSFREYDSLGSYPLCQGKSVVYSCRGLIEGEPRASLCIE